jgi:hypothetical protein
VALPYQKRDFERSDIQGYEGEFEKAAIAFSENSSLINIFVFSESGIMMSF